MEKKNKGKGLIINMSLDWNLIWTMLQVVALLIIAREIDKRIRKRKREIFWIEIEMVVVIRPPFDSLISPSYTIKGHKKVRPLSAVLNIEYH